ncbi:CPBP family intramembrane glutamic endopeptidase [Polaribacter aquimarinus]|uniref:CPBP family intramembrane metalloprotease n=1 Tax=Polaribacter aquimarinus TaxID=2100726 RepID=A0A2U2JC47_9FLAO|nr:type II CAAX endopeptidase family protein [Polaribacter aquimarinus]PWG05913.1 CPBP family intramembrane metalloprotease [Polaribacter aquimarinus]
MKPFLKNNKTLKIAEIIALFVGTPLILFLQISKTYKIIYLIIGVVYISLISIFIEKFKKKSNDKNLKQKTLKVVGVNLLIIIFLTTTVLYFQDKDALFNVILNKPKLWLKFSIIYILFSVIPQELIYRTFFLKRYHNIFKNEFLFIFINAILFSFAHIWFQSWIVLGFTFIGGILFIKTYLKTNSLWLVLLEHTVYGIWLYTVGYGKLFLFPV